MSLFNRKTALDDDFRSLNTHSAYTWSDFKEDADKAYKDTTGAMTGGAIGNDVYGLDLKGEKAAEEARKGAKNAADATVLSTEKNIDFQKWLWGEQKDLTQPFVDMGVGAIGEYQAEVNKGFTVEDMYRDPGYQFGMNEGIKARDNSAGAKGMRLSGATKKSINRFGTDYATTKFNDAFNRRQVGLDNLYRMIVSGQAGAAGQAQQGGVMGSQVSNSINTAGAATSQMYSDIGNINAAETGAFRNTVFDAGNLYMNYAGAKAGATPQ